ncbi:hypothetical protein E4U53_002922 [Claviceps sorghi]|nr:hypothetical protein E4U53_002922 [Claviceps sorghi]
MTIAAGQKQPPGFQATRPVYSSYDEDAAVAPRSPQMEKVHTRLNDSPSPPRRIPASRIRPTTGDSTLLTSLDNGRHPAISRAAGLPSFSGIEEEDDEGNYYQGNDPAEAKDLISRLERRPEEDDACTGESGSYDSDYLSSIVLNAPSLRHLAAGALEAVSRNCQSDLVDGDTLDIAYTTRQMSLDGDRSVTSTLPHRKHPPRNNSPSERSCEGLMGRTSKTGPASDKLPPICGSRPKTESNGPKLPSIRKILDFSQLSTTANEEINIISRGSGALFTPSSSRTLASLPPKDGSQTAPPKSPDEADQPSLTSPYPPSTSTSYPGYKSTGLISRPSAESGTGLPSETPNTEQSASTATPATAVSVPDRMIINGFTNQSKVEYRCTHAGCEAPAFQTQYLLNSHANVHSDARPHYCPIEGCPRSKGGNGFKRKNEMIRHGLVHTSPGYVCPFCPDREHKYPRPDNLQR